MDVAKHTDLLGLLPSLGYTLRRMGSYYTASDEIPLRSVPACGEDSICSIPSSFPHENRFAGFSRGPLDSIRIRDPTRWKRYSTGQGGDAITFLQEFCGMRFPEAVDYLLAYHGRRRRKVRSGTRFAGLRREP